MSISSRIEQIEQHLKEDYDVLGLAGLKGTELPIGYTQVDYIESSGTQYIDTLVKLSATLDIDVEFEIVQASVWQRIFGLINTGNVFQLQTNTGSATDWRLNYNGTNYDISNITELGKKVNFKFVSGEGLYVNNVLKQPIQATTSNPGGTIGLFKGYDRYSYIKIYSCKIYDNNVLIRNYVPCYRNSDNEVGMYDLVNNVFYANQGTGAFTYGSVVLNRNIQNLKPQWLDRLVYFMNNGLNVVWENWEKVTGTGTYLTLNNTINAPMKVELKGNTSQEVVQGEVGLEVEDTSIYVDDVNEDKENYITLKGNTYQETTTGKNLYEGSQNFSGTWANASNWITDSSTYEGLIVKKRSGSWQGIYKEINVQSGKTYTFSLYVKSDVARPVAIYISDGTATTTPNNKSFNTSTSWQRYSITFTCSASGTIKARLENTSSINDSYTYICGYQLEESSTMTDYEPYTNGASPNPDYPQEIEVVTGNNTIKVEGKNLLNYDNNNNLEHRYIDSSGNYNNQPSIYYINEKINVSSNTSYIFSFSEIIGNNAYIRIAQYKNDGTFISRNVTQNNNYTITMDANCSYVIVSVDKEDYQKFINLQLEVGSTATTYEAYQGASYPVNLGSIELCKIGTYQDRIYKNNGNWYLHKEVGKVVLDGTNVSASIRREIANSKYGFCFNYDNAYRSQAGEIGNILCSMLENKTRDAVYNNTQGIAVVGTNDYYGTGCFVYIEDTGTMSLNDFNTWLASNNMIVYYRLATPTDTQITDTTLVNQLNALYNAIIYSTTHINTETSNLLPYIDLKYNVVTASPSPDRASEVEVVKGNNTITISNENGTKTQTFNVNLGSLEFCKIGNYQDYIYYDKSADKWYKYKSVEKLVLDGTENYDMSSNGNVFYLNNAITNITSIENMKCNYYLYDAFSNLYNANTDYGISFNTSNTKIAIRDKDISSVNDFKTWLSNNNTIIYYPLSTPTTTQITDQLLVSQLDELQKAMSYYDKTLITQTNANLPFILNATALKQI